MKKTTKKDLVLKQVFGKRKRARKGFSGAIQRGASKTWGFVRQLKPIHSIAIVIVAVFVLQAIIPQSVLWPWFKGRAAELTGSWRQESWEGGSGQGETSKDTDKYDADDARISVLENFAGKAGFVSYANRSYVAADNSVQKPAVATDQSGRTLTVWVDERGGNSKSHLYARLVDSKGRALPLQGGSQDRQLDDVNYTDFDSADFDQPAVVYDPVSGRFVVVWANNEVIEGDVTDSVGYNVSMRTLRWTGSQLNLGDLVSVAGDNTIVQRSPHLAVHYRFETGIPVGEEGDVAENEIVITWQEQYEVPVYFKVMGAGYKIDSTGALTPSSEGAIQISKTFTVQEITNQVIKGRNGVGGPMVAITENGKVMIVWTADYDTGGDPQGDKDVRGRVYDISEFWPTGQGAG